MSAAQSPDGELIELCRRIMALHAEIEKRHRADDDLVDDAAFAENATALRRLYAELDDGEAAVLKLRPSTLAGLRALAEAAIAAHDRNDEGEIVTEGGHDDLGMIVLQAVASGKSLP